MTACPIPETELTGRRVTKLKGMEPDANEVVIEDGYRTSEDLHKSLQDRWRGETWLEMKAEAGQPGAASKTRRVKVDRKRKAEDELPTKDDLQETDHGDEVPDDDNDDDDDDDDDPGQDEGPGGAQECPLGGVADLRGRSQLQEHRSILSKECAWHWSHCCRSCSQEVRPSAKARQSYLSWMSCLNPQTFQQG